MSIKSLLGVSLLSLPLVLVACGNEEQFDPAQEGADPAQQIAAESCTTVSPSLIAPLILGDVSGQVGAVSPTANYGTSDCYKRFVVEATSTAGKPNLSATASYADAALTQAQCPQAWAIVTAFGLDPKTNQWVTVGSNLGYGQWINFFGGGFCNVGAGVSVPNTYTAVRSAGVSYFGGAYKKVDSGVFAHY